MSTFQKIVDLVDNYRVDPAREKLPKFVLSHPSGASESVIGWIREPVIPLLEAATNIFAISADTNTVRFVPSLDGFENRTAALAELCVQWRDSGKFSEMIGPKLWRSELYTVYYDPLKRGPEGREAAFAMERTCCALFGFITYGVHLTMYLEDEKKMWIPRRAKTKQTWPGYLDNTVAGGVTHGDSPTDAIVRECMEEASLPPDFVKQYLKPVGAMSYFYLNKDGWLQPEVQYCYDLIIPEGVEAPIPKPLDGEAEDFRLYSLDEIVLLMEQGLFKPNCALYITEFMVRHGYITPESEPNYLDIVTRLHGRWGL